MPQDTQPLTFLRAYSVTAENQNLPADFSEPTWLERSFEAVVPRAQVLDTMPFKYLRALVAFTDLRILQLTQRMALAADTITVAHVRGQLKEMENFQNALRWWLDYRKEGSE